MDNVEEQILSYPHLPVEEQREVEVYVEEHPEWAPLLRDVRGLESLIRTINVEEEQPADLFLTTYVVVQYFHPEGARDTAFSALGNAFSRLEQRLEETPALRERADDLRQKLEEAEASLDPVAHFEELTGHTLAANTSEGATSVDDPSKPARPDRETMMPVRSVLDQLLGLPVAARWAGAAVTVLLGAYTLLFAASEASESTLDRLATVDVSTQVVENYSTSKTRSAVPTNDTMTVDDVYLDALTTLRRARTSTLGLFPRYDTTALRRAETRLKTVVDRTEGGSFLALEAQFYLGKVHLAQGEVEAARSRFKTVVEQEGRSAQDARDILQTLREEYPRNGNATNS